MTAPPLPPLDPHGGELAHVLRLAAPLVAALTAASVTPVVDSLILASAGERELAAASLVGSITLVFTAGLYGFLGPVGYLAARARGAGRPARAVACRRAGMRLALAVGLLCAVLMACLLPLLAWTGQPPELLAVLPTYWFTSALALLPLAVTLVFKHLLDAIGRPWTPVAITLLAVLTDGLVSLALVHGRFGLPALGLPGAALGTLLAQAVAIVLYLAACRCDTGLTVWTRAAPARRARDAATGRTLRTEGAPMGIQYMLECGAAATAGLLVGLFGTVALAANQIATSVAMALFMVPLGLSSAVALRLSQAVGAGQRGRLWPIARAGLLAVVLWMGAAGVLMAVWADAIAALFTNDAALQATAAALLLAIALMQVADGVQSVSLGALRGLLCSRWPTRVSLLCYWWVALPLGAWLALPMGMGPAGVWYGFGAGLALAAGLLTRKLWQETRAPPA